MADVTWLITVDGTTIDNVQEVTIRQGRRLLTDSYSAGSAVISGFDPSSLPSINIGDKLVCKCSIDYTFGDQYFYFRVRDFQVEYGITANQDRWTLIGEDAFAAAGRALVTDSWSGGANTYLSAVNWANEFNILLINATSTPTTTTMSGQSFTDANGLQVLQTIANTEDAFLFAGDDEILWFPRNWQGSATYYNFTDDGSGSNPITFDRLSFISLADTAVTKVVVNPDGLASQSSGTGDNVYSVDTYSQTTTDAKNLADFLAGALSVDTPQPAQMSSILNVQANPNLLFAALPPAGVNINFRGSTYKALVFGVSVYGTPAQTRITLDLLPSGFYEFLVLDDATFGKLDENKLGW
jgi:hypothetical protein